MANELRHVSVGTELTQAEYEAIGGHAFDSQATGDIPYASSPTQLSRLPKGSDGQALLLASGLPAWTTIFDDTAGGTDALVTKAPTSNAFYDHVRLTAGVSAHGLVAATDPGGAALLHIMASVNGASAWSVVDIFDATNPAALGAAASPGTALVAAHRDHVHPFDGWIAISDAWAYASATTITVPSGAASLYQKGDKIRLTQTTVKYFYIVGVADTVLTITGGTSYTLINAAISAISYSHIANPMGFPHWFTFVPTIYGSTGSAGTFAQVVYNASFAIIGGTVFVEASTYASNLGSWTGYLYVQLPVLASEVSIAYQMLHAVIMSYNTALPEGWAYTINSGVLSFVSQVWAAVYPYSSLGTADVIHISARYKV